MPASIYKRKPPPMPARVVMGIMAAVVFRPSVRLLERLGLTEPVTAWVSRRIRRQLRKKNPFRNYVPTEHDVFVATYVKSGTNWMMQIAHQLAFHGNSDFEHIHCVVPWPDVTNGGPMRRYAIPVDDPSVWAASPEQKRVIKTHFNWDMVPYSENARYISVIRDPKDVFVSSYFFFLKNGPVSMDVSVETWFRLFLSDDFPMWGSWGANTAGYWAQRHRPNVLIVSFKEMKRDLRTTVCRVADFMNIRTSADVIDRTCEKSSFEYMKRIR